MIARYHSRSMLIVFNPAAGSARRRRLMRALTALRAAGLRPELAETAAPGDAERIARAAAPDFPIVVAAGGDGTIAEVAAGVAGHGAALGILPFGTANVLAHEVGLPMGAEAAAAVLAGGRRAMLHPGLATGPGGARRQFVQMAGAGFDAAVVHGLPLALKRRLGRAAYVVQTLRELARHRFPPLTGEADGEPFAAASAIVTKGRFYAGRYLLAPGATVFHPGFTLVLFRDGGKLPALSAGAALPLGLLARLPGVALRRARHVTLEAAPGGPPVAVQADGDAAGILPLDIADAPPIPLLVPPTLALPPAPWSDARSREEHAQP